MSFLYLFLNGEIVFSYSTDGTNPIIGNIFEGCSGSYAAVGIAYFRVVNITACVANVLFHDNVWFLRVNNMINFLYYQFWRDVVKTGVVTPQTWFLAEDAARTAVKVKLHNAVVGLVPAHETCKRMGGSPHTNYRSGGERSQEEYIRVHREEND
jgi:hypothetical protein